MADSTPELGDRVKDRITGQTGIAVGVTYWMYGCRRFVIQPEKTKDGKPVDTFVVDEPQLLVLKKAVLVATVPLPGEGLVEEPRPEQTRRHGPRLDPQRQSDPVR